MASGSAKVSMKVDGVVYEDHVEARTLLVHHLREKLGRVGTPIGCDTSNCGSCICLLYTSPSPRDS